MLIIRTVTPYVIRFGYNNMLYLLFLSGTQVVVQRLSFSIITQCSNMFFRLGSSIFSGLKNIFTYDDSKDDLQNHC